MIDTMKPLRKATYDILYSHVVYKAATIRLYDEKVFHGEIPDIYMLLSTQRERDVTEQDCYWQTQSSIDILFIRKTGSEVSKDVIDDISNIALPLLLNLPGHDNFGAQSGLQILEVKRESASSGNVQISPTQSELQKIVTLTALIIHS